MHTPSAAAEAAFLVQPSSSRYFADHEWLRTYHSFSFADYFDPQNLNWGALRVFNDDTIAPSGGFPTHPHRDMEIVTYVLDGELEHRDSMGNHGIVKAGGIQYMSAGTGVRHSEYNASSSAPLHLVQMWVLPRSYGEQPAYGQVQYGVADRTDRWLTVASGRPSVPSQTELRADASLHVARLEKGSLVHDFEPKRFGFLFVAGGEIVANSKPLSAGDALRLYDIPTLTIEGRGEAVLWDVPETRIRLEDA